MLLTPPAALTPILTALQRTGARVLVVGGTPRDALLGVVAHDWDMEIHGLGETRLAECLEPFGAHRVGGRCAVWVLERDRSGQSMQNQQRTGPTDLMNLKHTPGLEQDRRWDRLWQPPWEC